MEALEIILAIVCFAGIWFGGYIAGRFRKSWVDVNRPEVGELIVHGKEIYLSLYDAANLDVMRKHKVVSVKTFVIAEKSEPITE